LKQRPAVFGYPSVATSCLGRTVRSAAVSSCAGRLETRAPVATQRIDTYTNGAGGVSCWV
jgi:hypothetical protein